MKIKIEPEVKGVDDGFHFLRQLKTPEPEKGEKFLAFGSFSFVAKQEEEFSRCSNNLFNIDHSYSKFLEWADYNAFNLDGEFAPFSLFFHHRAKFYAKYGKEGKIFLRPNSGFKTVGSGLYDIERDLPRLAAGLSSRRLSDELIYISSPKEVPIEARFFVKGDEVIASSTYALNGENINIPNVPPNMSLFVRNFLRECGKDRHHLSVLDVTLGSDNRCKLLESNGYFTSATYLCDARKIVEAVESF